MISTLNSLFKNDEFSRSYFDYIESRKHDCKQGVLEDYCCGSIYRENPVFTPTTIQIQIGSDEFEPCSALKTKSGLHKMYGIYFEIRNIDPQIKSKLSNIHLIALVKSQDLKCSDTSKVAQKIVNELIELRTTGITISSGINLKAVLVNVSGDNLELNGIYGFVECFVATYFRRICELTSTECKSSVEEVAEKMRKKSDYDLIIEKI